MRHLTLALVLLVAACQQEQAATPGLDPGTFTGGGRDALCIAGAAGAQRAGFVVFGAANANCSASGHIEPAGAGWQLVPAGDAECKIPLTVTATGISLGARLRACAYYCGPGADYAGKQFARATGVKPVDLAGDPFC